VPTIVPLKYKLLKPGVAAKADVTGRISAIARAEKSAMVKVFILTIHLPGFLEAALTTRHFTGLARLGAD